MASFDTGWTYTTAMYLNVPHNIRVTGNADRINSTTVRVTGTFYLQRASGSYNYDVCKARLSNTTSWVWVKGYTTSAYSEVTASFSYDMSVDASATTIKIQGVFAFFGSSGSSQVGGEARTSEAYPAIASAPTGLSVTNISATSVTVTGTVSITGWGAGATSGRYIELNISPSKSTDSDKRRWQPTTQGDTSLSAVLTCSSSSSGTMAIQPNKLYYIGAYATNGAANTGVQWNWGSVVTKPDKLSSATVLEFDRSSATVRCVPSTNDGGQYTRSLKYSLNGGATVDAGTISTTKDITVTGLATGVTNTITLWITTTAGDSTTIQVQIAAQQAIGFYVSRNDERKKTIEAYCSPSGTRKRVLKAYYSVGGVRKLFYES